MKKISLTFFIIFSLLIANTSSVFAACYTAFETAYNTCASSATKRDCGLRTDGVRVCCDGGSVCPQDTEGFVATGSIGAQAGGCDIDTAIGCFSLSGIAGWSGIFLRIGIGLGGGVAFLMIIYAGFLITTSSGDPKRLQSGQELLGAAIGGVILLIFSVFILRVLGVNILGILSQ